VSSLDAAPAAPLAPAPTPPPGAPPQKPPPATWKLVGVLAGGGAIAGLLLVVAYLLTIDSITAHKKQVLADGVREVLRLAPEDRYDELWLKDGKLTKERPAGADDLDRCWLGRGADGAPVGWAVLSEGNGFADTIRLIFGWDAKTKKILALRVLGSKETPGLGDKIGEQAFSAGFRDHEASTATPLKGVKVDSTPNAGNEVDTITGATVSSRAVIRIINAGIARFGPAIEAYREEASR
jgi:electron transport complex protein RnfG